MLKVRKEKLFSILIVLFLGAGAFAEDNHEDVDYHQVQSSMELAYPSAAESIDTSDQKLTPFDLSSIPTPIQIPKLNTDDVIDSVLANATIKVLIYPFFTQNYKQFGRAMASSFKSRPSDPYGPINATDNVRLIAMPKFGEAAGTFQVETVGHPETRTAGNTLSFNLRNRSYILDKKSKKFDAILVSQDPHDVTRVEWVVADGTKRAFNYYGKFLVTRETTPRGQPTVKIINLVDIEKYVADVIPGEMPISFPLAALEAQAVAARTYAYNSMIARRSAGVDFDIMANTADQLYMGASRETENSSAAALNTARKVLVHNDHIIMAMFHANSGGKTVAFSDYDPLRRHLDYLVSKDEFYRDALRGIKNSGTHIRLVSETDFLNAVRRIGINFRDNKIVSTVPVDFNDSGRATSLKIKGPQSEVTVAGSQFRQLCSAIGVHPYMAESQATANQVKIPYYGIGHGVGMCQEGAKLMALYGMRTALVSKGKKKNTVTYIQGGPSGYEEILNFYYPQTQIINFTKSLMPTVDVQSL